MLSTGGFQLHKWSANNESLLKNISESQRELLEQDDTSARESIKALGLRWKPNADVFVFDVQALDKHGPITKRSVLVEIAKLYDPLGWLAPIVITTKLLIQSLWKEKSDWETPISENLGIMWNEFRIQLIAINKISIPRCVIAKNPMVIELHGFSDASEHAYGACIYIKSIDESNGITVRLLCSKTRVAPLKTVSLPRLELCAALLLSRLVTTAVESLEINFNNVFLWSDSMITLQWIQIPPYKLKTFVANRVNEIQELTSSFSWNHVDSVNNPADIISRGCMPSQLKTIKFWWNGPEFLYTRIVDKPIQIPEPDLIADKNSLELKQDTVTMISIAKNIFISFINRFGSFLKLVHSMAYILRYLYNLRNHNDKRIGLLSIDEINNAILKLIKIIQQSEFEIDIRNISKNKDIKQSNLKSLNMFLDNDYLLRVGGRIKNSSLDYEGKHQLLLPANHHFVRLLFRFEHQKNLHAGPQLLLSIIRKKYWPINGMNTAKQTCRKCVSCFKATPTLTHQLMGDLPSERITPSKPFNTTGVDLCGPFQVKNKRVRNSLPYKVYIACFVCFATKAIRLEIVSDLTSEAFISCLKRFVYRRGNCSVIWSDNATNFVGANHELKRFFQLFQDESSDILKFNIAENIRWKFIPPRSPNFGGLWESTVRSVKYHLKRIASACIFSYEELYTLLVQIEGILNSRPLTKISSDPNDPEPLTPAHFLTGGPPSAPIEPSYLDMPSNRLQNWKKITQLAQLFWKRYQTEYFHTLQQRYKWKDSVPNLKINDLVLIAEDNFPSTRWLLGIVVNVYSGADEKVRVADVKTKGGIFKRSVAKLAKLPIDIV